MKLHAKDRSNESELPYNLSPSTLFPSSALSPLHPVTLSPPSSPASLLSPLCCLCRRLTSWRTTALTSARCTRNDTCVTRTHGTRHATSTSWPASCSLLLSSPSTSFIGSPTSSADYFDKLPVSCSLSPSFTGSPTSSATRRVKIYAAREDIVKERSVKTLWRNEAWNIVKERSANIGGVRCGARHGRYNGAPEQLTRRVGRAHIASSLSSVSRHTMSTSFVDTLHISGSSLDPAMFIRACQCSRTRTRWQHTWKQACFRDMDV